MLELAIVGILMFLLGISCGYGLPLWLNRPEPAPDHEHVFARLQGSKAYCLFCDAEVPWLNQ